VKTETIKFTKNDDNFSVTLPDGRILPVNWGDTLNLSSADGGETLSLVFVDSEDSEGASE